MNFGHTSTVSTWIKNTVAGFVMNHGLKSYAFYPQCFRTRIKCISSSGSTPDAMDDRPQVWRRILHHRTDKERNSEHFRTERQREWD